MRKHFFFEISKDTKQKSTEEIVKNLQLPENKLPPRFLKKDGGFIIGGYFVSYHPKITIEELVDLCRNEFWTKIAQIQGDFLIFYFDRKRESLFVLTSQNGKFPCYFYIKNHKKIISTSLREIFKRVDLPKIDIEKALEFIYRDIHISDKTIIKNIRALPPATLCEFKAGGACKLTPLLNVNEILNPPIQEFSSLGDFGNAFVEVLEELVKERLAALDDFKYCAEISSGFDSTLVCYLLKKNSSRPFTCYSEIAESALSDTQPEVVKDFANKHTLKVKFIKYDDFYPFSTKKDLELIKDGPSYIQKSQFHNFLDILQKGGNLARFTGEGGDEAYWSSLDALNLELRYPAQKRFFDFQTLRNYGIDKILTKKGVEKLLKKERFKEKNYYPLYISHSLATLFINFFPLAWEKEVWPMSPFEDARLIELARSIPSGGVNRLQLKQKMWQERMDIFTKSQFIEKRGTEAHYSRFLTEKRDFIISTLKNSRLAERGWVRSSEIIDNITKGEIDIYYKGDAIVYLTNFLELEYFIQQNNIKV